MRHFIGHFTVGHFSRPLQTLAAVCAVFFFAAAAPVLAEDDPEIAELQAQVDELEAEQAEQEEQIRRVIEQIQRLEAERDELSLGRRSLQDRLRRLRAEQSALRSEAAGRTGEARDRRRLDDLDAELARLRLERDEVRLESMVLINELSQERNEINAERAAAFRDPGLRELGTAERRAATYDLERRSLEVQQQLRTAQRDLAVRYLEIDRQKRAVGVERYRLMIEISEGQGRGDSVTIHRRGLSKLARESARQEMEEVFGELLWEDEREIFDLRLQLLDADGEERDALYARLRELSTHANDLRQLRQSQRRQAHLEKLEDELVDQFERLERTRATAGEKETAAVFEQEIQKLRDAVKELAGSV